MYSTSCTLLLFRRPYLILCLVRSVHMTSRAFRVPGDNFYRYEATVSSSPIPTKALTSCVAYGLGDFTAQLFTVSLFLFYKKIGLMALRGITLCLP